MTFKWPWQYDFPPFFTLQQTLVTREKQLEAWSQLVTDYAQHNKIHTLDVQDATNTELFCNPKLNRRLNREGVRAVFDYLEHKKHVEWLDPGKTRCHIYWKRPDEWAALIYDWAVSNGFLNTPCTLYEIAHGDDTANESFYGLEKEVLIKALRVPIPKESNSCNKVEVGMATALLVPEKSDSVDSSNLAVLDSNAPSFFKNHDLIQEGDTVIIYVSYGHTHTIIVKRGITLAMKYGALRHEFIIDKPWGSKISATAGYVYALRPTPDLWTRSLPRRTQILYTPDCSLILQLLDARPGMVICESGTGSGSLSHALALAIAPNGHLYTHDIEETRTTKIIQEFKEHGLSDITTAVVKNVCTEGFFVEDSCDGVFLDVPAPWEAIPHAANALSKARGGRLVSFSPCIEQVQRACEVMRSLGFVLIETVECVPTTFKVVKTEDLTLDEFEKKGDFLTSGNRPPNRKRHADGDLVTEIPQEEPSKENLGRSAIAYPQNQPTHTGYLTHATMLPYN